METIRDIPEVIVELWEELITDFWHKLTWMGRLFLLPWMLVPFVVVSFLGTVICVYGSVCKRLFNSKWWRGLFWKNEN